MIETPQPNLVAGMKWLLGTYTGRYNRRHKEFGHLFSGRYKALVVEGSGNGYLKTVCDYVHLNPSRSKLVNAEQPLEAFPWSSYRFYLQAPGRRPAWLRVDRLLGEWRIPKDSAVGRRAFGEGMERRRREDLSREFKPVERGWCLGSQAFRRELLAQVSEGLEGNHSGEVMQEAAEVRAEQWVAESLKQMGLDRPGPGLAPQGRRREGATGIRTAGQDDDAAELDRRAAQDGSRGYLTWLLHRYRRRAN